jgi:hypothetical protein
MGQNDASAFSQIVAPSKQSKLMSSRSQARGKPLTFIILLLATWFLTRTVQYNLNSKALAISSPQIAAIQSVKQKMVISSHIQRQTTPPSKSVMSSSEIAIWSDRKTTPDIIFAVQSKHPQRAPLLPILFIQPSLEIVPPSDPFDREYRDGHWKAAQPSPRPYVKPRASTYGYSFWRKAGSTSGLAPASQYGGGQSGLIGTYRLGESENAMAILWRVSVAHARTAEQELAFGIRWQPTTKLPITLSAERRFRNDNTDNIAFYIAGGKSDVPLVAKFKLDTYAQIGILTGAHPDRFFDANVRVDRPVFNAAPFSISAGGGLWAGGQKGASRIDIGPSMRTDFKVSDAHFRLNADWRFRIAGNAAPGDGPTITLSTNF